MSYIQKYSDFYIKNAPLSSSEFSQELIAEFTKDKQSFDQSGLVYHVEPLDVSEEVVQEQDYTQYIYKGKYLSGFEKQGVYYGVPGDDSTVFDRNDESSLYPGEQMIFWKSNTTGVIESVYDSMNGNTFGKKIKKKKGLFGLFG